MAEPHHTLDAPQRRRDFWSWWRDGLHLWWREPSSVSHASRRWLQLLPTGGFLTNVGVSPRSGGEVDTLTTHYSPLLTWLAVPSSHVVRAPLHLPLAALDHLNDAMQYQIERLTPFKVEDVVSAVRVISRDAVTSTAIAELVVMPRVELESLLERVRHEVALSLAGVDVVDEAEQPLGLNLLPSRLRATVPHPWRNWNALLACFALASLVVGLWFSLQRERQQGSALEAQLRTQTAQARIVSQQRDRLRALTAGAEWVANTRASQPQVTVLLNALAERIPDSITLEQLRLQEGELQVQGVGPNSAALISALRSAPHWGQPALAGTTTAWGSSDRFTIRLPLDSTSEPGK